MGRARGCRVGRVKGRCKVGRAGPLSPPLGPPVLEPGLDLRVRHFEGLGERRPLGRGQVLLAVEALFQLTDLHPRKGRARLLTLGRRPVLVGVADAPGHREGRERCRRCGDTRGPLRPSPAPLPFRPHADPVPPSGAQNALLCRWSRAFPTAPSHLGDAPLFPGHRLISPNSLILLPLRLPRIPGRRGLRCAWASGIVSRSGAHWARRLRPREGRGRAPVRPPCSPVKRSFTKRRLLSIQGKLRPPRLETAGTEGMAGSALGRGGGTAPGSGLCAGTRITPAGARLRLTL